MRTTVTRHVLERIFGFAEPAATASGRLTYECLYCGAAADDGATPHHFDCSYWLAVPSFAKAGAARLVEQAFARR